MHFIYTKNGVQYCIDDRFTCDACISNQHQIFKYQQLLFCIIVIGIICLILIKTPFWFINIVAVISLPYMYLLIKNKKRYTRRLNNEEMIAHCIECGHTNIKQT
jgi:Flp pilus assembly protein TadB